MFYVIITVTNNTYFRKVFYIFRICSILLKKKKKKLWKFSSLTLHGSDSYQYIEVMMMVDL